MNSTPSNKVLENLVNKLTPVVYDSLRVASLCPPVLTANVKAVYAAEKKKSERRFLHYKLLQEEGPYYSGESFAQCFAVLN